MTEIIVNGQPLPIHFGMKAINEFTKGKGTDFSDTVTSTIAVGSLESIVALTAVGLNDGARRLASDKRYTEDEVWDMFDDDPGLILKVSEIFIASITPLTDKLGDLSKNGRATAAKK